MCWRRDDELRAVARVERSETRGGVPGLRGACHRAALRADPLAPSGLQGVAIRRSMAMREKTKFSFSFMLIWVVQSSSQKYSAS
jgi:hypothetical protein